MPECLDDPNLIDPSVEYAHDPFGNAAVTGGFVYRGTALPDLQGKYIYGDLRGRFWKLESSGTNYYGDELINRSITNVSFGVDNSGELYFLDFGPGRIGKIVPADAGGSQPPAEQVPVNLADTGCANENDPRLPATGMIPYDINAAFWSDEAVKTRYLAIPDSAAISINDEDDWIFPVGSVLRKDFKLNGRLIETRLFMLQPDGGDGIWQGFSYRWDETETSAEMVVGGLVEDIDGQSWIFPSGDQCLECHTQAATATLGPETAQLNGLFHYPSTDLTSNQLLTFDHIGLFDSPLPEIESLPALSDPFDIEESLNGRARAYLHTNCAQCHRPGSGVPTTMDLRYQTSLMDTNACNIVPGAGDLGIGESARLISPGIAAESIIVNRMSRRDFAGMPPLGSNIAHSNGATLITEWINNLDSCN